jgi:hypothetical protein
VAVEAFYRVAAVLDGMVRGEAPITFLHSPAALSLDEAVLKIGVHMQLYRCRSDIDSGDGEITCHITVASLVEVATEVRSGSCWGG